MKKRSISLLSLFSILSISNVSAFPLDLESGSKQLIQLIKDITSPFFETLLNDSSQNEFFFVKVLIMILLFLIINAVFKKIPRIGENSGVSLIISAIVAILSVRYISDSQLITGILLPYTTLGIVVATAIPFLIFFWLINTTKLGGIGRRIGWAGFGIVYAFLWKSRYSDLSPLGNQIYGALLIMIIAAVLFDRKIHEYFSIWEIKKLEKTITDKIVLELLDDLEKAERHIETDAGKQQATNIRKRLRELGVKNI